MSKARVILSWMTGGGLSPGQIENHIVVKDEDDTAVTQIVQHDEGHFELRTPTDQNEHEEEGVIARINSTSLSLVLEPLVDAVCIELSPGSRFARAYGADRMGIPRSDGVHHHYVHLRPDDTINFQHQGLKVTLRVEVEESSPARETSDAVVMPNFQPEVQVKSSNVASPTDGDDAEDVGGTTSDEDEFKEPASSQRSVRTPAAEVTPATSRPTAQQPTIKETPTSKQTRQAVADSDNEEAPWSTAPINQSSGAQGDAIEAMDDLARDLNANPTEGTESPSMKKAAERMYRPTDGSQSRTGADVDDQSDTEDELPRELPKAKRTYGKVNSARGTPLGASSRKPKLLDGEALDGEALNGEALDGEALEGDDMDVSEVQTNGNPAAFTSEPLDSSGIAAESAKRSLSHGSIKRKTPEEDDDEDDGFERPAVKKHKTDDSGVPSNAPESDSEENLDDVKPMLRAKRDKRARTQENNDETEVAPQSSRLRKPSPEVVVSRQSKTGKAKKASESPSSSAASALSGKVPKVLLSNDSPLRLSAAKWLKEHGSAIIDDVKAKRANFVCVVQGGKLSTTAKVLRSLALGKLVVTEDWIKKSKKTGEFLDPEAYVHPSLKDTIHADHRVFDGKNLFFTDTLVKGVYGSGWSDIQELAKEAGASSVQKGSSADFGKFDGRDDTICFGAETSDHDVARLISQFGCTVYRKSLLTDSILNARLELDDEESKLSVSGTKRRR